TWDDDRRQLRTAERDVTEVSGDPTRARAALQLDIARQPPRDRRVEPGVGHAHVTERAGASHDRAADAEKRWLDIVEAAERLTAAAGEPGVDGRGDAIGVEIVRRHRHVLLDPEVAVPAVVHRAADRQALGELMLDGERRFPVVHPLA